MRFVCILFALLLSSCYLKRDYVHDNPVEEWIEDEIELETGIKIDFTGSSPE